MSENENSVPLGRLTSEEVASQPSCWKTALQQGREQPAGLPAPGEQVLVLGCGTSYYLGAKAGGEAGIVTAILMGLAVAAFAGSY